MPNKRSTTQSIKQKTKQVVTQKVVVNVNKAKTTRKKTKSSKATKNIENSTGNNQTIGSSGSFLPYIPQMTFIPSPYNNGFIPENYKSNTDNRIQTLEGMMKTLALDYDITKGKAIQLIKQGIISPTGTNAQTPQTPSPTLKGIRMGSLRNVKIKSYPHDRFSFPSTSQASTTPRVFDEQTFENPIYDTTPSTSSPNVPKRLFDLENNQFYVKKGTRLKK